MVFRQIIAPQTRADRRLARTIKQAMKDAKRAERREARRERPKGLGPEIDWSLSTTIPPQQFPSAFDDSNPIVAGVGRTLSRGMS